MSESLILSCEFCIQFVSKLIIVLPDLDQSIFTCPRASILPWEFCIQFVGKLIMFLPDLDQPIFTCPRASILSWECCIQFVTKLIIFLPDLDQLIFIHVFSNLKLSNQAVSDLHFHTHDFSLCGLKNQMFHWFLFIRTPNLDQPIFSCPRH